MRALLLIAALGMTNPGWGDEVRLRPDAPERHVVVKGDTLWGISERFLRDPWLWPRVWRLNREQIRNPHRIYPGDVVRLTIENGEPRLSLEGDGRLRGTVRLSPSIRGEPIATREQGIPAIPLQAIQPFMSKAGVIDPDRLERAPRLLGAADERVLMTRGDVVYATGGGEDARTWHIVRPGKDLIDPDTGDKLGFEAVHVGDASTVREGDPRTLRITAAHMEIGRGDRLLPSAEGEYGQFVPRAPAGTIEGRIISAFGGLGASGQHATVVLNKGARDGLEPGHVLAVYHEGREVASEKRRAQRFLYADTKCLKPGERLAFDHHHDPGAVFEDCPEPAPQYPLRNPRAWRFVDVGCLKPGAQVSAFEPFNPNEVYKPHCRADDVRETIKLPDTRVGLILVYKVHERAAYALVLRADGPLYLLDPVRNP